MSQPFRGNSEGSCLPADGNKFSGLLQYRIESVKHIVGTSRLGLYPQLHMPTTPLFEKERMHHMKSPLKKMIRRWLRPAALLCVAVASAERR
jgi:hypothetical protein